MRQNLIFNVKVIDDSNRGFSLFRKGILKSKGPTVLTDGMDGMGWDGWDVMGWSVHFFFGPVLSPSTPATGYQAPPPILLTDGMDGWDGMGWDGRSPFFFWPIS